MSYISLTPLASGSKGNASLLSWEENQEKNYALVDCGLPLRTIKKRLAENALLPENLSAIIVTHEHGDHIKGVAALAKKYHLPIYISDGTRKTQDFDLLCTKRFSVHDSFEIKGMTIHPFPVPHDARETCGFIFHLKTNPEKRLGYLTDCGHITPFIVNKLKGIQAIAIESNHCPDMLRVGPYPPALRARVSGSYGHLSNEQARDLLKNIQEHLTDVRLMHISEKNNTAEKALAVCSEALTEKTKIGIAYQNQTSETLSVYL